jgi:hypothetical protein
MKPLVNSNNMLSVGTSKKSLYKKAHQALEYEIRGEETKALIDELKMANRGGLKMMNGGTPHHKRVRVKI